MWKELVSIYINYASHVVVVKKIFMKEFANIAKVHLILFIWIDMNIVKLPKTKLIMYWYNFV